MRRRNASAALLTLLLGLGACGSTVEDVRVDVPPVPRIPERVQIAQDVGQLLAPDPERSKAAGRRLMALDGEDRQRFLDYVATLEGERDLRLLNVLDEQHALPEMSVGDQLDFLLWKSAHPERFYVMKAQSRLIDLARKQPDAIIGRLGEGGRNAELLGVVLALAGTQQAMPALIERYELAESQRERAAAAEALGILAGEERRPRPSGTREEIARDAAALEAWYAEQLELAAERSAVPPPTEGEGVR